jgi:hypothetical protein
MRVVLILALVAACTQPAGDDEPPVASHVESFEVPGQAPPQLDLLIVVDDTPAMAAYAERTAALLHGFDDLWAVNAWPPRPDLHVAVATADPAEAGQVRTASSVHGAFLVDESTLDYLARTGNHDGALGDAVAALGAVGTAGSASQPLAAARAALEANPDFLRPDAYLAIVIVTAHDDASSDAVADVAAWAKALKADPTEIVVSVVAPASAPRLDELLGSFPNRSARVSIDDADYAPAVALLTELYKVALGLQCLDTPLDLDPALPGDQYDCTIELAYRDGTRRVVPACPGELCWTFHPDSANCPFEPGGQIVIPAYPTFIVPTVRGQCVVGN